MGRACEFCGDTEVKTSVMSSGLVAMSLNTCYVCAAMHTEYKSMLDEIGKKDIRSGFRHYDKEGGYYVDYKTGKPAIIMLKNGRYFKYRKDYIGYSKAEVKKNETKK